MIKKLFANLIRFLNLVFPKINNSIYMRSSFLYPDNIDAVLDELLLSTKDKYMVYLETPKYRYAGKKNVKHIHNRLSALYHYLTSKYVFWDIGMFGNPKPIKSQITINLWHGTSFKKIGFYETQATPYQTSTYIISYSETFKNVMSFAFGIPFSNVLISGEPRNDYLFKEVDLKKLAEMGIDSSQKLIMWMPTYRQSKYANCDEGKVYDFGFPFLNETNLFVLNEHCKKMGVLLILKWHALQKLPCLTEKEGLSNLLFLTSEDLAEKDIPLYNVLGMCSGLITDYSSVFINYLVLDRPICFAYDDLDYYKNNRGFMFDDIESMMPGLKAENFDSVLDFIGSVANGKDDYKTERLRQKQVFNAYSDDKNSRRLLKMLGLVQEGIFNDKDI